MITGIAMLNWPVSAVTINVARDATDKDHHRLRERKGNSHGLKVIESFVESMTVQGFGFKVSDIQGLFSH
jgi:hypothetical protein